MIKDRKSLNVIKLTISKLIRKGTSGMLFESDLQEFVAKLPNNFSAKKFWLTVFLLKHRRFQVNFSGNLSSYFLYGFIHQQVKFCSSYRHCVKNVRIRSFSGPYFPAFELNISTYSVRMRENKDQKNSEYGHFSHIA